MASGSTGGGRGRGGGGGRSGRSGAGRYTAAQGRRVTEAYTAPSRSVRQSAGGRSAAIPSRWLL